jgi:hypothetical protein
MSVPPLSDGLVRRLGEGWILLRLDFLFGLAFFCLVPGAIGCFLESRTRSRPARAACAVVALGLAAAYTQGQLLADWRTYLSKPFQPAADRDFLREYLRELGGFVRATVPRGATVLVADDKAVALVALHDCHLVASPTASNGVPDLAQRRADLGAMLAPDTPWPQRRELLRKYGVEYVLPFRVPADWAQGHILDVRRSGRFVIVRLRTDSP